MMTSFVAFDWKQFTLQLLWEVRSGSSVPRDGKGRGTWVNMLTTEQMVLMGIRLYMKPNLCIRPLQFYINRYIIKLQYNFIPTFS
jgi:hypothetical protein